MNDDLRRKANKGENIGDVIPAEVGGTLWVIQLLQFPKSLPAAGRDFGNKNKVYKKGNPY
jgi:hypothetical protein